MTQCESVTIAGTFAVHGRYVPISFSSTRSHASGPWAKDGWQGYASYASPSQLGTSYAIHVTVFESNHLQPQYSWSSTKLES